MKCVSLVKEIIAFQANYICLTVFLFTVVKYAFDYTVRLDRVSKVRQCKLSNRLLFLISGPSAYKSMER